MPHRVDENCNFSRNNFIFCYESFINTFVKADTCCFEHSWLKTSISECLFYDFKIHSQWDIKPCYTVLSQ